MIMRWISAALVALALVSILPAGAEWDQPGSRPKSGQALWSNKRNQYGGHQYAGITQVCATSPISLCSLTAYTVDGSWCGTIAQMNNAATITVTLPSTIAPGCSITFEQEAAGKVTFVAGSGAVIHSKSSFTGTSGQYAIVSLIVVGNFGGQAAEWILVGDGS